MRFHDQVAILTAGAGGIARAAATIIAREGGIVVLADNHQGRLDEAVAAITAEGGRAYGRAIDALDEAQVNALTAWTVETFGGVEILVNALGGSTVIENVPAHVDELTFAEWKRVLDFNLDATFLFCHAVAPVMKARGRGKIVNLSSLSSRGREQGTCAAYGASKAAISTFTTKLAYELGPFGINVNAIAPGVTLTERVKPLWWDRLSPEEKEELLAKVPLRRLSQPEDQANVICFLASSAAAMVTGVTIDVNGGV